MGFKNVNLLSHTTKANDKQLSCYVKAHQSSELNPTSLLEKGKSVTSSEYGIRIKLLRCIVSASIYVYVRFPIQTPERHTFKDANIACVLGNTYSGTGSEHQYINIVLGLPLRIHK